jgi:hypothetical protein
MRKRAAGKPTCAAEEGNPSESACNQARSERSPALSRPSLFQDLHDREWKSGPLLCTMTAVNFVRAKMEDGA